MHRQNVQPHHTTPHHTTPHHTTPHHTTPHHTTPHHTTPHHTTPHHTTPHRHRSQDLHCNLHPTLDIRRVAFRDLCLCNHHQLTDCTALQRPKGLLRLTHSHQFWPILLPLATGLLRYRSWYDACCKLRRRQNFANSLFTHTGKKQTSGHSCAALPPSIALRFLHQQSQTPPHLL